MTTISKRTFVTGLSLSMLGATQTVCAQTATYPARPVKVIVPFPAGGAADITMRLLGPKLEQALGQSFVIENRVGANGSIGATAVARADADGHTLLFAPREVFSVNQSMQTSPGYDPIKDLAPIGIATEGPYVLVAHPSLGIKNMASFLAAAKATELSYSSFGVGSMGHLNPAVLAQHAGVRFLHVPFRGGAAALQAVVGGDVAFSISTPPNAQGFIVDGQVIGLAAGAAQRLPQVPEVPTLAEVGLPLSILTPAAFAMAAPAATPAPILARLNSELTRALAAPDVTATLAKAGLVPASGSPDAMARMIAADGARFSALIKMLKIKPE